MDIPQGVYPGEMNYAMSQQRGITKGNAHQKLGSAGFIFGALLILMGVLLLPPSIGAGKWLEMQKEVGEQAVRLQACALIMIFGYWAVMIGTAGVYNSISAGGCAWARIGFYFHLMGTAIFTIGMAVGDVAYPAAAANWLAAPDAGKEVAYSTLAALPGITRGLFPMEVIVIWLAFAFIGIGMAQSAIYPRWLGWVGLILGITGTLLGILQTFIGRESSLNIFMVLMMSTIVWWLGTGIWVARKVW